MINLRKTVATLILCVAVFGRTSFARDSLEVVVHKIELPGHENFYGSALLIHIEDKKALFVTAAHVLPKSKDRTRLRILGPLTRYQSRELRVRALLPGDDLAFLEMPIEGLEPWLVAQLSPLLDDVWIATEVESKVFDTAGLVGFADPTQSKYPDWSFLSWKVMGAYGTRALSHRPLPPAEILVTPKTLCGPLFIEHCYELNVSSSGYSGGAFFVAHPNPRANTRHAIAGLVTHYSPLLPKTYVLPSKKILERLETVLLGEGNLLRNETGHFEFIDEGQVRVLKGPLKGVILRSAHTQVPGGGDISGGGGLNSSRPPPHVGSHAGSLLDLRLNSQPGSKKESRLDWRVQPVFSLFMSKPALFKGVDNTLAHEPGVEVVDETQRLVRRVFGFGLSGRSVWADSLAQFLQAYVRESSRESEFSLIDAPMPSKVPSGLVAKEWGVLLLAEAKPMIGTLRQDLRTPLLGRLISAQELVLELPKSSGVFYVRLLGLWEQSGNFIFHYRGLANMLFKAYSETTKLRIKESQEVFLSLSKDPKSGHWDLKFLSVLEPKSGEEHGNLSDRTLMGAALRLSPD